MFWLTKKHFPIVIFLIISIFVFGYRFLFPLNYEFLIYIFVILVFFGLILFTNKNVKYPMVVLWLLAVWAVLHMAGWAIIINDHVLYQQILIPIINSWEWQILRYDQFIHIFWFFTATVMSYAIIRQKLKIQTIWFWLGLILVMAGCGFGAFNEVIEFIVDTSLPESWVGGYINTSLDLVSNLIGSLLAIIFLKIYILKK